MKARQKTAAANGPTMLDHVKELRLRLLVCAAVLVIGGIVGYMFYEPILQWLKSPLVGDLYYSAPSGSFSFVMKIATMAGIAVAIPLIIHQMIMFVRPALPVIFSRKRIVGYTALSVLLAAAGVAFAFYVILPGALRFFAGFQVEGLSALIAADSYLSFVTNVLITFMLVFQLPLLLVIIDHIKPIQPKNLLKAEKYVVLGGLVISFFVPFALDITTSLLIATPIIILYNLSIVLIVWRHSIAERRQAMQGVVERFELSLDDAVIAEFFAGVNDRAVETEELMTQKQLSAETTTVDAPGLRGLAMEFQRSRGSSIEELRRSIERDRAEAIARKVAHYNATMPMRRITDIR